MCCDAVMVGSSALPVDMQQDEFYIKHLVQRNAFESVITAFVENGERYNMLNSAVLELLDFIRKENIKVGGCCPPLGMSLAFRQNMQVVQSRALGRVHQHLLWLVFVQVLVAHIVESYGNKLEDIEYVDTYK
jgi:hypothetical protein